jgi:sortase A
MTQKIIIRVCAVVMALSGVVIIFSTLYPILSYEWEASQKYPILISPLVDSDTGSFKFSDKDYTKAENWFENVETSDFTGDKFEYFTLTIRKLKIESATVVVGGDDLSQHLIQFPGTALPGKVGNSVIFGHSILPQYFDPGNYLAIFSTLPTLEKGDEVVIEYENTTYKYLVREMFEVRPTDIQILEQSTSSSYLTLVTCTPPGHPLKPKRLIVRAELVAS